MGSLSEWFLYTSSAALIGSCGFIAFSIPPTGANFQYGSEWHRLMHYFGNYTGTSTVGRASIPDSGGEHVYVSGFVCDKCGHKDDDAAKESKLEKRLTAACV